MPSNITDEIDTITQRRFKAALMEWLNSMRFHTAMTLAWNRTVTFSRARDDLRDLMGRVDRELVGSHYPTLRSDKRTEALFVFEGLDRDHVHVHSLWKAPKERWFDLGKLFGDERGGVWTDVVPSGTCKLAACNWSGGNDEIIGYVLKEQHRWSAPDLMVWASDFHRAR